ncbi:hypothetical protein ISS04_02670 [Candidatus Woesearchaeota archaeon]|nr:hypothetical protein [Candidatus Woesearchaeota archaeon]
MSLFDDMIEINQRLFPDIPMPTNGTPKEIRGWFLNDLSESYENILNKKKNGIEMLVNRDECTLILGLIETNEQPNSTYILGFRNKNLLPYAPNLLNMNYFIENEIINTGSISNQSETDIDPSKLSEAISLDNAIIDQFFTKYSSLLGNTIKKENLLEDCGIIFAEINFRNSYNHSVKELEKYKQRENNLKK